MPGASGAAFTGLAAVAADAAGDLRKSGIKNGSGISLGSGSALRRLATVFGAGAGCNGHNLLNGRRACAADEARAALFQNLLHALDGVAIAIQKPANTPQQSHIIGPVIAPGACPLQGFYLGEFAFPKAQDMLGNIKFLSHLAYCAKGVC